MVRINEVDHIRLLRILEDERTTYVAILLLMDIRLAFYYCYI